MVYSDFTKQEYSGQDFLRLIEQRIRKEIRQHHLFDEKKDYQLIETTSLPAKILSYFLKQIFDGRLSLGNSGETIHTEYLEAYVSKKLSFFLEKKDTSLLLEEHICPLRSVTGHEIQEIASLLGMADAFTPIQDEIIEELQKKYPQTKPSFLKSFSHIEQLQK